MKLNKYFAFVALGMLGMTSCTQTDDPLEPSGNYSPVRFEFPQGDNEWDKRI